MANIEDYLDWRSDVPFDLDPFNEVDNLILCELVYTPFEDVVPGPGLKEKISLEDACAKFFSLHSDEEILEKNNSTKVAPFLMRKMINTKRYKNLKLSGYVSELDAETSTQFAAITYYLPDGTIFVAFRGTDDTLIGWKEDFNMCFSSGTGGQLRAVKYLNDNFSRTMKKIRVGGHSKGGNFAVYSSAFCKDAVKDNIVEVYSNDGPGFIDEVIKCPEYKSIIKRVHSNIPQQSIVGLLMDNKFKSTIVKSTSKGIGQHNLMTWQVLRNRCEEASELDSSSIKVDETIKAWVKGVDYETRNIFGDIVFSALEASGATKLSEVAGSKIKSAANLTSAYNSLDKEQQQMINDILTKLVNASGETVKSSIKEILPNKGQKSKKKKEK